MKHLRRFLQLPSAERRLLVKAALLLGAIRLGLWLLPFRTLRRVITQLSQVSDGLRKTDQRAEERLVWGVTKASQYVPKATCLTQALAAQVLLTRRGHPALLRIGVVKGEEGRLEAHAWLESRGEVVIGGSELERYTRLAALEGDKP